MLLFAGSGASTAYEKNSAGTNVWSNNTANGCTKVTRYSAAYVNGDYATICANVEIGSIDTTHSTNNNNGVSDLNIPKINFKNPVHVGELVTINNIDLNSFNTIQLFDMTGRLIETYQNEIQITIPSVRTGIYILKINGYGYKIMIKQ
jgi:hypothetical protein